MMRKRHVRVIGVPLDLGAGRRGVDMGPSAIRLAGFESELRALGHEVTDWGNVDAGLEESIEVGRRDLRFMEAILAVNERLARVIEETLEQDRFPLVLGGDHSIAIGSLAGASSYLKKRSQTMGVIWIDAHADMNTPETTPSGNIHGMSLAVGLGLGDPDFVNLVYPGRKFSPDKVALVGARDLDDPERHALNHAGVHVFTMREIDEHGLSKVMKQAIELASDATDGVYVQFDMDVIDPSIAPGTGTPVPGGLSYREAHLVMEMLSGDAPDLLGLDIVETNPALDVRNQTGKLASELVLSLLGKTIYRPIRFRKYF